MPAKKLEVSTSLIHSHKVPEGVAVAWGLVVEDDMTIGPERPGAFVRAPSALSTVNPFGMVRICVALNGPKRRFSARPELSVYWKSGATETEIIPPAHAQRAHHQYRAPNDGELVFILDNSFSWLNSKAIALDVSTIATGPALLPEVIFVLGGPGAGQGC